MVRELRLSLVQCTILAIATLWPARCKADAPSRRLFGISVQAVPEPATQEAASTTGQPLVEAPTAPRGQSLPGYSIYHVGSQESTHAKNGFGKAQWLLLGQFLFVFWLVIGVLLVALFSLERCGIFENYVSFSCCPSCCYKLEQHWHMSKAFFNVFFLVLLFACAFTGFCVYAGLFHSPPRWFNRMEKAEAALISKLPFQIPGASPLPPFPSAQPPAEKPIAATTSSRPQQVSNLAARVVALKKQAEANATAKPTTQAPLIVALRPRAPVSPCVSATPPPFTTTAAQKVQNFVPPGSCICKASDAQKHYVDHCQTFPGAKTPVCVVDNPACSTKTVDAGQGNGDKLVECVVAPAGGTHHSVTLDTSLSSSDLGMKIVADSTAKNLLVTQITGGIVGTYNAAHPGAPIKVGDLITAVNSISGASAKLQQECAKKQQLVLSMSRQGAYPIGSNVAAVATTPAPASKCPGNFHPWGQHSVCLSNSKPGFAPGTFGWHCPWESMILVSTRTFGGCPAVQYDCAGMNIDALLDLYSKHDNMQTPPPEGSLQTVEYVACCVRHQCQGQPLAKCGIAPWVPGKSVSPFAGKANPSANPCADDSGSGGCARRYSVTKVLNALPSTSPVLAVSGISLLLVVGAIAALRRRAGDEHHLLAENDTEACTNEVEVE